MKTQSNGSLNRTNKGIYLNDTRIGKLNGTDVKSKRTALRLQLRCFRANCKSSLTANFNDNNK